MVNVVPSVARTLRKIPTEGRAPGQIRCRRTDEGVSIVCRKRHVARQSLPVQFDHLGGCLGTTEGRWGTDLDLMRIESLQLKRIRGLGIRQGHPSAQGKGFEGRRLAGRQGVEQRRVGRGLSLPQVIVR